VVQRYYHVCACRERDLEFDVGGYDAFGFQALEDSVARQSLIVVSCADGEILQPCDVALDFGAREGFRRYCAVHHEWADAFRHAVEDAELLVNEECPLACLAVWKSLQATWHACDALAENGLGVGVWHAAY
jgi:hypothetical protein